MASGSIAGEGWVLLTDFVVQSQARGSGKTPHCFYCEMRFQNRRDLVEHEKKSHNDMFVCSYCQKRFDNSVSLRQHSRAKQHSINERFKLYGE